MIKNKRKMIFLSIFSSCVMHGFILFLLTNGTFSFLSSTQIAYSIERKEVPMEVKLETSISNTNIYAPHMLKGQNGGPLKEAEQSFIHFSYLFPSLKQAGLKSLESIGKELKTGSIDGANIQRFSKGKLLEKGYSSIPKQKKYPFSLKGFSESFEILRSEISDKISSALIEKKKIFTLTSVPITEERLSFLQVEPFLETSSLSKKALIFKPKELPKIVTVKPNKKTTVQKASLNALAVLRRLPHIIPTDFFDLKVSIDPVEKNLFAVTLIPQKDAFSMSKVKQNFLFILDKSYSMDRARFQQMRYAVLGALSDLAENHNFNVWVFGDEVEKLSETWMRPSISTIKQARGFLINQAPIGFLSSTNLLSLLESIRNIKSQADELTTVVLLTDGSWLSRSKNYQMFEKWTRTNPHSLVFHSIALKEDKHLALLEFFAARNRGKLLTAATPKAFKRNVQKLIKRVAEPIATDVSIYAVSKESKEHIDLWPTPHRIFPLYLNDPLVILGKSLDLKDFDLFVQGKNGTKWVTVRKKVTFNDASLDSKNSLGKEWAICRSHICYERFFREKNFSYIESAKELLNPYQLKAAIE